MRKHTALKSLCHTPELIASPRETRQLGFEMEARGWLLKINNQKFTKVKVG